MFAGKVANVCCALHNFIERTNAAEVIAPGLLTVPFVPSTIQSHTSRVGPAGAEVMRILATYVKNINNVDYDANAVPPSGLAMGPVGYI